jgi:Uma2 family endonuclease
MSTTANPTSAAKDVPGVTRPMTYEEYLAGPEEMRRYDILDGWKVYRLYGEKQLPNPTREHQEIALNLAELLRAYQRSARTGQVIIAPCDVMITRRPLRNRQPDLLFISNERLSENPPSDDPAPLSPAPELVVEIVRRRISRPCSPPDRRLSFGRCSGNMGRPRRNATIEVVRPTAEEIETDRPLRPGQSVVSRAFPDLSVPVDAVFARIGERMEPFTKLTGIAAPLDRVNADTDQIIPKQF